MQTYLPKKEAVERKWWLVSAEGKTLGRLASQIAKILRGKTKVSYTPYLDTGDFVVVVNADKVTVTGKKLTDKIYYWHSMYPGGLKSRTLKQVLEEKPEEVIIHAVKGMLPKTPLGRKMLKKLKVYRGPDHPHQAQRPEEIEL